MKSTIVNPKTDGVSTLFEDLDQDEHMAQRLITVGDREFTIKADIQYGLWSIFPKKGKVPKDLSGKYTTAHAAQIAIEAYATHVEGHAKTSKNNG